MLCSRCDKFSRPNQSYCYDCRALYAKEYYNRNKRSYLLNRKKQNIKRRKWLNDYKESRGCSKCNDIGNPAVCYEFNHITGDKYKPVGRLSKNSMKRILNEIEKCELICRNCHMDYTYKNSDKRDRTSLNTLRAKKRLIVDEVKNKPCTDCGRKFGFWQMEMDHIDGSIKRYTIRDLVSSNCSIRTLLDELNKTEPVCGVCHAKRSLRRRTT